MSNTHLKRQRFTNCDEMTSIFASRKADTNIGVVSITDTTEALG